MLIWVTFVKLQLQFRSDFEKMVFRILGIIHKVRHTSRQGEGGGPRSLICMTRGERILSFVSLFFKILYNWVLKCQYWTINEELKNIYYPLSSNISFQHTYTRRVSSWFYYLYFVKLQNICRHSRGSYKCDQLWQRQGVIKNHKISVTLTLKTIFNINKTFFDKSTFNTGLRALSAHP